MIVYRLTIEATFDGQMGTKIAIAIACPSFVSRNLRNRKNKKQISHYKKFIPQNPRVRIICKAKRVVCSLKSI